MKVEVKENLDIAVVSENAKDSVLLKGACDQGATVTIEIPDITDTPWVQMSLNPPLAPMAPPVPVSEAMVPIAGDVSRGGRIGALPLPLTMTLSHSAPLSHEKSPYQYSVERLGGHIQVIALTEADLSVAGLTGVAPEGIEVDIVVRKKGLS